MFKYGIKTHEFKSTLGPEVNQAITKYMIEAASIASLEHWRVDVKDMFGQNVDYRYNFSSGGAVSDSEMEEVVLNMRLHIVYYEVFLGEIGLPDVRRRAAEITFIAKEDDGTRNIAVENAMYPVFADMYCKALDHFPTRIFFDGCYIDGKKIR